MKREGQAVPQVRFRTRSGNDWKNVTSDEIFKGRTVVVFSLPGAFTPTCSSTHLPRYNELAPAFFANGVDAIVCVSVNDAFVMNEWAAGQECANLTMLPDGNGEFTDGMGLLVDKSDLGYDYAEVSLDNRNRSRIVGAITGAGTVPQVFVNGQRIGGFDELERWARKAA